MFWKKKDAVVSPRWRCKVTGCDFVCDDYITLQKHTFRKHPGFKLHCEVDGCDFTCDDYQMLERHTSWKHPQVEA
ncbi:MAG: hypothetical protein JSV77_02795 [Dehalococcoidales bacterium]|nr:MAG: hypothetical protein JSV77_02795 [Dehalococcoidales bacterium]